MKLNFIDVLKMILQVELLDGRQGHRVRGVPARDGGGEAEGGGHGGDGGQQSSQQSHGARGRLARLRNPRNV